MEAAIGKEVAGECDRFGCRISGLRATIADFPYRIESRNSDIDVAQMGAESNPFEDVFALGWLAWTDSGRGCSSDNSRASLARACCRSLTTGESSATRLVEQGPTCAVSCDHFVPVFPLIPAYSRSESRNYLDFLRVRSGFEPEGRGFESLPACQYLRASQR